MSKITPAAPIVEFSLSLCWVSCCRWKCLQLRLHGIHCHSNLWKMFHELLVATGKDCIVLWQSFHFLALCLHSLENRVQVFYSLMVIFGGGRGTPYILPLMCIPPFLWWWPLSFVHYRLGGKRSWNRPMSWGRWFAIFVFGCPCWSWLSVKKGWSLWTPSLRRKLSFLLHTQILSPFLIAQLNGLGVPWGSIAPSFLPHFPQSWFRISPRRR